MITVSDYLNPAGCFREPPAQHLEPIDTAFSASDEELLARCEDFLARIENPDSRTALKRLVGASTTYSQRASLRRLVAAISLIIDETAANRNSLSSEDIDLIYTQLSGISTRTCAGGIHNRVEGIFGSLKSKLTGGTIVAELQRMRDSILDSVHANLADSHRVPQGLNVHLRNDVLIEAEGLELAPSIKPNLTDTYRAPVSSQIIIKEIQRQFSEG